VCARECSNIRNTARVAENLPEIMWLWCLSCCCFLVFCLFFFGAGVKPRASNRLGKHSTAELHPSLLFLF
jgi:hypothetical protein